MLNITRKQCAAFASDRTINPISRRKIQVGKGTYQILHEACNLKNNKKVKIGVLSDKSTNFISDLFLLYRSWYKLYKTHIPSFPIVIDNKQILISLDTKHNLQVRVGSIHNDTDLYSIDSKNILQDKSFFEISDPRKKLKTLEEALRNTNYMIEHKKYDDKRVLFDKYLMNFHSPMNGGRKPWLTLYYTQFGTQKIKVTNDMLRVIKKWFRVGIDSFKAESERYHKEPLRENIDMLEIVK